MLSEEILFLDYLTYAGWGLGFVLLLVGLLKGHLRILILIGIAVPVAALLLVTSQKIVLKFEVVITTESDTGLSWRHVNAFTGGEYVFRDGTRAPITKPEGGPIATVVINDSDRPVRVVRVAYTANPQIPGSEGQEEIAVIEPGALGHTLARIGHFGPESEGPPGTMKSVSSFGSLDWLNW